MTMILHVDCKDLSSEDLNLIPDPPSMGARHHPVAHKRLVKAIKAVAYSHGFDVGRERFGSNKDFSKIFGVLDLISPGSTFYDEVPERGLALGFRNSTKQHMGAAIVGGHNVFVCDNLALNGDMVLLKHKNTAGMSEGLIPMLEEAFERFTLQAKDFEDLVLKAEQKQLSKTQAEVFMWDAFVRHKILPIRLAQVVDDNYFHPEEEWTDITKHPYTLAALHNAFTRAIRDLPMAQRFDKSRKLGKLLEGGVE